MSKYYDLYFFKTLFNRFFEDEISTTAAALSYYMIFSFFPLLVMLSIIFGRLGIGYGMEHMILNILPDDIVDIARMYLQFVNSEGSGNILFASVLFTIYFPIRSVKKLMDGINIAYNRDKKGNTVRRYISVVLFGIGVYIMIICALFMISVGETAFKILLSLLNLPVIYAEVWGWLKFIILWCVGTVLVIALHYVSAGIRLRFRDIAPGCVLSTTVWTIVSVIFSLYVKYIGRYSLLYGSIGAVMILLYWLFLTAVILLMGAEFSSVLILRKERLG